MAVLLLYAGSSGMKRVHVGRCNKCLFPLEVMGVRYWHAYLQESCPVYPRTMTLTAVPLHFDWCFCMLII